MATFTYEVLKKWLLVIFCNYDNSYFIKFILKYCNVKWKTQYFVPVFIIAVITCNLGGIYNTK